MTNNKFFAVAKGLLAAKPPAIDRVRTEQWQYTVRHVVGELSLRNSGFDVDAFYKACGYVP